MARALTVAPATKSGGSSVGVAAQRPAGFAGKKGIEQALAHGVVKI